MLCEHPLDLYFAGNRSSGTPIFTTQSKLGVFHKPQLQVPCGKCFACRYNHALEWRHRLEAECWSHKDSSFITLTYRDDSLLTAPDLKANVQRFIKRFRHLKRDFGIDLPSDFRYYICKELGSTTGRPHHHGILFGLDLLRPEWQPKFVNIHDGYPVYSSGVLEKIWKFGFVTCDTVTPAVADYITKYVMKQSDDSDLWSVYSRGLGVDIFFKDGFATPFCRQSIVNRFVSFGKYRQHYKSSVPKYVLRRLRSLDPESFDAYSAISRNFILSTLSSADRSASDRAEFQKVMQKNKNKGILDNE